ncbi:MAG: substrate-binding domain-containing protein [Kiritimatiellae bacterium]|nr:substrate-binding domain-containing protein [Kiritimatiellia bacterium]
MKNNLFTILHYVWITLRELGLLFGGLFAWVYGSLIIAFSQHAQGTMILAWGAVLLSLYIAHLFKLANRLRARKITLLISVGAVLVLVACPLHRWYTVERFKQLSDTSPWHLYQPFRKDTRAKWVEAEPQYHLRGDLPDIGGAYALYPLYAGAVRSLCEPNAEIYLSTSGSDTTFKYLLNGQFDLIFSPAPSKQQEEDARARNLTYHITPIAREAFVFFVHRDNPVDNLTQADIRAIYSGQVTRWETLNPAWEGDIKPFQRNEGSGSQTRLQRLMGDTPIMPPLREDRLGGMGGIINDVADYRNHHEAIGFSFRYFTEEMFRNGDIKLLSIDGIAPTLENIQNGSYPFLSDFGIITVRPRSENTQKLVDFFFSPAGQELIKQTGYVPLPNPSPSSKIAP